MKKILSLVTSSLHDLRCCDESVTLPLGWRALTSSITCLLDGSGHNTGFAHVATLEQFTIATGLPNGETKPNSPSDPNYIANYSDISLCPIPTVEVPDPPATAIIEVHNNTPDSHVTVHITSIGGVEYNLEVYPHGTGTLSILNSVYNVNVVSTGGTTQNATICNGNTIPLNQDEHHDFGAVSVPILVTVQPN
jgi:hypothetical protein